MEQSNKVVVFIIGKEEYGIPIETVLSIEKLDNITPIPHLPNYVRGILKVRDELVPVLDGEQIFYGRPMPLDNRVRIIILRTEEMSLGLIVHDAKEILDIPKETIKQVGLVAYKKTSYFTGVANLETRLVTIVSPQALVQSLEGIREIQEYMQNYKKERQC